MAWESFCSPGQLKRAQTSETRGLSTWCDMGIAAALLRGSLGSVGCCVAFGVTRGIWSVPAGLALRSVPLVPAHSQPGRSQSGTAESSARNSTSLSRILGLHTALGDSPVMSE